MGRTAQPPNASRDTNRPTTVRGSGHTYWGQR